MSSTSSSSSLLDFVLHFPLAVVLVLMCDLPYLVGGIKTCESYAGRTTPANSSDTSVCPKSRCNVEHGVCTTNDIQCSDICNQILCDKGSGCKWSDSGCVDGNSKSK